MSTLWRSLRHSKMEEHNVEQGSEEWFALRAELLTASDATAIKTQGAGLNTLVLDKVVKNISSAVEERYENADTLRGHELESIAAGIYELETGNSVRVVGFVTNKKYPFGGCSPDRFVGEDGNLQIKAPSDMVYAKILLANKPDIGYVTQCQMEMMIGEKKWTDLMFYNPNFPRPYIIFRILPDEETYKKLEDGLKLGGIKMQEIKAKLCK